MVLILVSLLMLLVAVVLAARWYSNWSKQRAELAQGAEEGPARRDPGLIQIFLPQIRQVASFSERLPLMGLRTRYSRMIEQAGLPFELSADEFLAIKGAAVLVTTGGALMLHVFVYQNWAVVALLSLVGLVFPDLRLMAAVGKQKHACLRALPGFLDLLALSVEAGMGFDSAVLKLTEVIDPGPLIWRFQAYLRSVSVGKTHAEALREMAQKMDLPDFTAFANAVLQTAETGASLAPVLRTASIEMLTRRFERAEKAAHQLAVKILLPLFVFVFPSTFLMIIVPLYFRVKESGALDAL